VAADPSQEFFQTCRAEIPRADDFLRTRSVDKNFICEGINNTLFKESNKCANGVFDGTNHYVSVRDLGSNGFRELDVTIIGDTGKLSGYAGAKYENHYGKLLFFVGYDCGPYYYWARIRSTYTRRYFDDVKAINDGSSFLFPLSFSLKDFDHRLRDTLRSITGSYPIGKEDK
jgi:hypothetical protein